MIITINPNPKIVTVIIRCIIIVPVSNSPVNKTRVRTKIAETGPFALNITVADINCRTISVYYLVRTVENNAVLNPDITGAITAVQKVSVRC